MAKKSRFDKLTKVGGAGVGSAMAGVDGAVFRNMPPPLEVVEQHSRRGPVAADGGRVLLLLPEDSAPSK